VGTAPLKEQVVHFVNKKLPGGLQGLIPGGGEKKKEGGK